MALLSVAVLEHGFIKLCGDFRTVFVFVIEISTVTDVDGDKGPTVAAIADAPEACTNLWEDVVGLAFGVFDDENGGILDQRALIKLE